MATQPFFSFFPVKKKKAAITKIITKTIRPKSFRFFFLKSDHSVILAGIGEKQL
jgi:hypothetical protein